MVSVLSYNSHSFCQGMQPAGSTAKHTGQGDWVSGHTWRGPGWEKDPKRCEQGTITSLPPKPVTSSRRAQPAQSRFGHEPTLQTTQREIHGKAARPPSWQDRQFLGWNCPEMSWVPAQPSACTGRLRAGSTGSRLATAAAPACHPPLGPFPAPCLNPTTAAFLPGGEESLTHALAEINERAEEPGSSSEPAAESPAPAAGALFQR